MFGEFTYRCKKVGLTIRRITLFSFSLLVLICAAASPAIAGQKYEFPSSQCSAHPPTQDGEVACKYLGRPDGIPTYRLLFGQAGTPLMDFIRSAKILQGDRPYNLAVNSYEGSNYTDCYVFWNANNPRNKLSLARIWMA